PPEVREPGVAAGAEHDEADPGQPALVREQLTVIEPGREGPLPRVAAERRPAGDAARRQVRRGLRPIPDGAGPAARHAAEITRHTFHDATLHDDVVASWNESTLEPVGRGQGRGGRERRRLGLRGEVLAGVDEEVLLEPVLFVV